MYALDKSTGRAQQVNSIPAGSSTITWGATGMPPELSSALGNPAGSTPTAAAPGGYTTPVAPNTSYGATNTNPTGQLQWWQKPPLPSSVIQQYKAQVANGSMSMSDANAAIRAMDGQYDVSGFTPSQIQPPAGATYTGAGGSTYTFDGNGTANKTGASQYNSTTGANGGNTTASVGQAPGFTSTGNPNYDALLSSAGAYVSQNLAAGSTINPNISITPELVAKFLQEAHASADPYYKQQVDNAVSDINGNLQQLTTDFNNKQAETLQGFGTQLATQDNAAANNGVAFSGGRNLADQNLQDSTNRVLSTNAADTSNQVGSILRAGATNVGSTNTGRFNLPTLLGAGVSTLGGQRGSTTPGQTLSFNYDPTAYGTGALTSQYNSNLVNQSNQYLKNYLNTAANATSATPSFQDLTNSGTPKLTGSNLM